MRYIVFVLALFSTNALAASEEYIKEAIEKAANKVGIPVELLDAVCFAESRHVPSSFVFSDGGNITNHAFGICQVLYNTAKEHGMNDERCMEDFRYRKDDRNYQNCQLFGPYTNALYAAKYLKKQLDRYNGSWVNAIAAYNSGSVQICGSGWVYRYSKDASGKKFKTKLYKCEKGGLLNQRYVDRVLHSFVERSVKNEGRGLKGIQSLAGNEEVRRAIDELSNDFGEAHSPTQITGTN